MRRLNEGPRTLFRGSRFNLGRGRCRGSVTEGKPLEGGRISCAENSHHGFAANHCLSDFDCGNNTGWQVKIGA